MCGRRRLVTDWLAGARAGLDRVLLHNKPPQNLMLEIIIVYSPSQFLCVGNLGRFKMGSYD